MPSILALDQGTTGSTALVIHEDGNVLGRGYREFTQHFPEPGWVEHDAEEIFQVTVEAAREAVKEAGEVPAGIGITNQRETVVVWERKTLRPVQHAIVWQDRRTTARCRELKKSGHEQTVRERTGLVIDPYFSATKLEWILRDEELKRRALAGELAFGTIDSWLVARLTGGAAHVTDHTNASRTMLYNLDRGDWDPELLELFGVPREVLPELVASGQVVGEVVKEHLGAVMPIAGIAGDQQAALYGQGCVTAGQAKNTYGTGAFLLVHTGDQRPPTAEGLLTTVAAGPKGEPEFALEGSIFIAGAAVQWLRDGLGILEKASDSEEMARSVPDNGGVYFVPAFVGLGTPHWEPNARGTITGLTRGSSRAHLVRAALESMAYGTADLLDAMEQRGGLEVPELRVDGGASQNDWLMQFQADMLGRAVERPDMVETTALGAAGLAGVTLGIWKGPEDLLSHRQFERFEPSMSDERREELRAGWERAVGVAVGWAGGSR